MSQTWLIPVDGSTSALKAIDWVALHAGDLREPPVIHLINVQPALPRDISRFINADELRDFHREEGLKVLATAQERLLASGLTPQLHVTVGECAETIADFARQLDCDQIILGTRGHTGLGGTLLGSVAAKVTHIARVPVLLVR